MSLVALKLEHTSSMHEYNLLHRDSMAYSRIPPMEWPIASNRPSFGLHWDLMYSIYETGNKREHKMIHK